jgi:hypothetical protein
VAPAAGEADLLALTNPLLPHGDLPLEVSASSFAGADGEPVVAIVLGVPELGATPHAGQAADVLLRVLDYRGQEVTTRRGQLALAATAARSLPWYALRSTLSLAPGRYEFRVAVRSEGFGAASVYTDVEVPDFQKSRLTASSLVLTTSPAGSAAEHAGDIVPVIPLTQRSFSRNNRVSGFVRVYQQADTNKPAQKVAAQIVNVAGDVVVRDLLAPRQQAPPVPGRITALDYELPIPLEKLPVGEYFLKFEIGAADQALQRALRFRIE